MSKDILLPSTKEFSDTDIKVLTCAKTSRTNLSSGNRIGNVRNCSGFDPEISYESIILGGLCQEGLSDLDKICDGANSFLPHAVSVRDRSSMGGIGIVFKDGSEVIMKKPNSGNWKPLLNIPIQGLSNISPSNNLLVDIKSSHPRDDFDSFIKFIAGEIPLPEVSIPIDDFGASAEKLKDLGLITLTGCNSGDTCIKLTAKGLHAYSSFHRGKPNDGLNNEKEISRKGGVGMEFEGLVTGLEKTSSGERRITLMGSATDQVRRTIAEGANVDSGNFNIEGTGRLELKNVESWQGRSIPKMINEIEKYENVLAQNGFSRPEFSSILKRTGTTKLSGGIHMTFTAPVTNIDKDHKDRWDLFMANWLRLTQWWEPLLLGASGSPSFRPGTNDWIGSFRHHRSWSVKAGGSGIERLKPDDGAVSVYPGPITDWHRKSVSRGGTYERDPRSDFRITSNRGLITWTHADADECRRYFSGSGDALGNLCSVQTDAAVELRFFEYEPLPNLEERASVIALLMDRAYQLAAQDIEVPQPRDRPTYNELMWKFMEEADEAILNSVEAKEFSKVFTGDESSISPNENIFSAGKKIVDDLWEKHYDDFFTKYFGVNDKPTHMNYMKVSKEGLEEYKRQGKINYPVASSEYGIGGRIIQN